LGVVPENEELIEFDVSGRPLIELGDESPVYQAIAKILAVII
jgi:CO dehydrogenase nickel-insertion accessory protein CooC1